MGGRIGAESEKGHGSRFWFELEVALASEAEVEARSSGTSPEQFDAAVSAITARKRAPRVLVVEDNATNQLVAKSVLANFGIVPDVAGNGLEAIDAVRRHRYDVVLMDIHMPEMDGFDATRAIRSMKGKIASTPIIALTANAFAEDIERCREAGMNGHVSKPFRKEELIVALVDALEARLGFPGAAAKPGVSQHAPLLDDAVIGAFRADSGEEMLRVLLDTYLADTASKLKQLSDIAREGKVNREALRIAHSLKSASAMAGAVALAHRAAVLEAKLNAAANITEADARAMQELFDGYREALKDRGLIAA
jgi:CheY-like chemotaxis protein